MNFCCQCKTSVAHFHDPVTGLFLCSAQCIDKEYVLTKQFDNPIFGNILYDFDGIQVTLYDKNSLNDNQIEYAERLVFDGMAQPSFCGKDFTEATRYIPTVMLNKFTRYIVIAAAAYKDKNSTSKTAVLGILLGSEDPDGDNHINHLDLVCSPYIGTKLFVDDTSVPGKKKRIERSTKLKRDATNPFKSGIGSVMISYYLHYMFRSTDITEVVLTALTPTLIPLYHRFGFQLVPAEDYPPGSKSNPIELSSSDEEEDFVIKHKKGGGKEIDLTIKKKRRNPNGDSKWYLYQIELFKIAMEKYNNEYNKEKVKLDILNYIPKELLTQSYVNTQGYGMLCRKKEDWNGKLVQVKQITANQWKEGLLLVNIRENLSNNFYYLFSKLKRLGDRPDLGELASKLFKISNLNKIYSDDDLDKLFNDTINPPQ
jgi:hypothetical protein